jgi:hypothetical protein
MIFEFFGELGTGNLPRASDVRPEGGGGWARFEGLGALPSGERYTGISVVRRLRYSNERTGELANGHIGV